MTRFQYITDPQRQGAGRQHILEIKLTASDILKIIALIGGIIITCLLIACAYLSGLMIMVLGLIGFLVFMVLMAKDIG